MNRLLWAVAGVVVLSAGANAADPPGAGKERTLLEQEFHLPERPGLSATALRAITGKPTQAEPRSVVGEVRGWLTWAAAGQLGGSPRVRIEVW